MGTGHSDLPRFYFSTEENTCRKYLCHEQPEAVFSVTQQKTDSLHLGRADGENESTALHACIVQHLIPQGYLLFHGSCLALDGQAILFTAPSGTGKSTHSRLWRERFGTRVEMVNDDKPLLQLTPHGWLAHGTPWSGKHSRNSRPGDPDFDTPAAYPLRAIVVIKRGETNTLRRFTPAEAAHHFFHQTYFPSTLIPDSAEQPDAAAAAVSDGAQVSDGAAQLSKLRLSESNGASSDCRARAVSAKPIINSQLSIGESAFALRLKALDLMGKLTQIPIYELHCTISQQAVDLTLNALRENTPG